VPYWGKRYEPILEARPVPAAEALKQLLAKELVQMWEAFPPAEADVDFLDPTLRAKLAGRLHELPALDVPMVSLLARILVLDLLHTTDAIDHLFRNHHHREAAPTERHVEALHLLWRAILEHLYARKEEAGFLKTTDLVDIVNGARDRFVRGRVLKT
jgi:hypothetical protein